MDFGIVFGKVIGVFSLLAFGVVAEKAGVIREEARPSLSEIVILITIPSLIIAATLGDLTSEMLTTGWAAPVIAMILAVVGFGISTAYIRLTRFSPEVGRVFQVLCIAPNTAFIGFPINYSLFGEEGLIFGVLYDIGMSLFIWSLCIWLLSGEEFGLKTLKNVANPAIGAMVICLIMKLASIQVPEGVLEPFKTIGSATVPLAMLLVGSKLAQNGSLKQLIEPHFLGLVFVRLVTMPLVAYGLCIAFGVEGVLRSVVVLESAMPAMASTPILAEKFGGDVEFAASGVFVTTLVSVVTIPIVVFLL